MVPSLAWHGGGGCEGTIYVIRVDNRYLGRGCVVRRKHIKDYKIGLVLISCIIEP